MDASKKMKGMGDEAMRKGEDMKDKAENKMKGSAKRKNK